jgi:glycosyltransferase involved in cell wall biosynthesis
MAFSLRRRNKELRRLQRKVAHLTEQVEALKSRYDLADDLVAQFLRDRQTLEYQAPFDAQQPLVSVCIPTYDRPNLLVDRCVKSVIVQTYRNIEIIIVGDCCTEETSELLSRIADSRIRYENLSERGAYPADPEGRWLVGGSAAVDRAMELATGDFITHLDDDDEYTPERTERLVEFTQKTRADLVFHPFHQQLENGEWRVNHARSFDLGKVTSSSVFYHHWLKRIQCDFHAYRFLEPGDWNRYRRMKHLGARIARYDEPLVRHYKERSARDPRTHTFG